MSRKLRKVLENSKEKFQNSNLKIPRILKVQKVCTLFWSDLPLACKECKLLNADQYPGLLVKEMLSML